MHCGPEIKYLLQGGMSWKGTLSLRASRYLISMENSALITGPSYMGSVAGVPGQESGREQGAAYSLRWVPWCQGL